MTSPSMPTTSVTCVMRREPSRKRDWCTIRSNALGDLLADRLERQLGAGHEHHGLDAGERVARAVGVRRADRAVVAGVHRLEHVEGGGVADLADHDAVGAHAQGVADQVADLDLALALDVRRARLEADDVLLVQLELGGVLDRDDALVVGDERRQHVERGRLAGAGTAGDHDVEPAAHALRRGTRRPCVVIVPNETRSSASYGSAANLRMVSVGPSIASGGMMALTRLPSGRRASTIGRGLVDAAADAARRSCRSCGAGARRR